MASLSNLVAQRGTVEFTRMSVMRKAMLLLAGALVAAVVGFGVFFSLGLFSNIISLICFIALMVLCFTVNRLADNAVGYSVVILSGFLIGALATPYITYLLLGGYGMVVVQALVSTFLLFGLMAAFAFLTNIDFTRFAPFISIAILCFVVISLLNVFFFKSSGVALFVSYGIAFLACGSILLRLNYVARGGQMTAVSLSFGLLIDLYNLFMSLLRILSSRN